VVWIAERGWCAAMSGGTTRHQVLGWLAATKTARVTGAPSAHCDSAATARPQPIVCSCGAGHNYIGTEHILMGLLREGEGVAARVLETLGADQAKIRTQARGLPCSPPCCRSCRLLSPRTAAVVFSRCRPRPGPRRAACCAACRLQPALQQQLRTAPTHSDNSPSRCRLATYHAALLHRCPSSASCTCAAEARLKHSLASMLCLTVSYMRSSLCAAPGQQCNQMC